MNRPSVASSEAAVLSAVSEAAALSEEAAAAGALPLRKNMAPEHQCHHGSDAHADTGLCALAQLFTGGDALEEQQRDGNKQDAVHDGQQDEPVGGVLLGGNGLCACSLAIGAGGGQSALPVGAGNVLLDTKIENYLSNFEKDFAFGSPQPVTPVPHPAPSSR